MRDGLVLELCHISEGILTGGELHFDKIEEFFVVLGFPIETTEEGIEVIFQNIAFTVAIEVGEDRFEDVFIGNEA